MKWVFQPDPFGTRIDVRGHALAFDLGEMGHLVAALATKPIPEGGSADLSFMVANAYVGALGHVDEGQARAIAAFRGGANVPTGSLPQFIWFYDRSKPFDAKLMNAASLGQIDPALRVALATVITTSAPVQSIADNSPPWFRAIVTQNAPKDGNIPYGGNQLQGDE